MRASAGDKDEAATLAAVGTWGMQLHTFRLPDLSPAADEALGSEAIPRSVLLAVFDGAPFLLCALGDGQLYNFHIDADTGQCSSPLACSSTRCRSHSGRSYKHIEPWTALRFMCVPVLLASSIEHKN